MCANVASFGSSETRRQVQIHSRPPGRQGATNGAASGYDFGPADEPKKSGVLPGCTGYVPKRATQSSLYSDSRQRPRATTLVMRLAEHLSAGAPFFLEKITRNAGCLSTSLVT